MADNTLPNEQERLPEPQRQPKLLHHLRTEQLVDVPPGLLKDPWSSTRPFVGLVADCDKVRQVFLGSLSKGQVLGALVAIVTLAALLEVNLAELWAAIVSLLALGLASAVPGLGGVVQVVPTLGNALGAALLVYYAMNLTGQVSNRRNALALDLNGLYHDSPSGPLNVSWRNVLAVAPGMAVVPGRTRWLRVWLEDGGVLHLRVPEADRDWLVDVIRKLCVQVVPTLGNALGAALLVYYAMNLTGQVSNRRNALALDLNGLYHDSPSGPLNVSWRNVLAVAPGMAVVPGRTRWLRVWLEDGGVLHLRVPEADRDWLVDVIRKLLRHHHQDLHGTFPDPEAPCPTPTEPRPELPEIGHGRPQLRDRYTVFVAERDQVFAAMPDDMTDADKQREFAEFLRWQDIRSR